MTTLNGDVWVILRLIAGRDVAAEVEGGVSPRFKAITRRLHDAPLDIRGELFAAFLDGQVRRDEIDRAMATVNPDGPQPPPDEDPFEPATLADIRRDIDGSLWIWAGWIPAKSLCGIAGKEGVGKTRFALDLAARAYRGEPFPDGQASTQPPGSKTVWVCSDGQQGEILETAETFGLPDDAVTFAAPKSEAWSDGEIDTEEDLSVIEKTIAKVKPAYVFVDSLTNATTRNVCAANEVKALMTPFRGMAQKHGTTFVFLCHVSREGEPLGRRVKASLRTIMHLRGPGSPSEDDRVRFEVSKSFGKKPPALGLSMSDEGNTYDSDPPSVSEPAQPRGTPPKARDEAGDFIVQSLSEENDQIGNDMASTFTQNTGKSKRTFWRTAREKEAKGELALWDGPGFKKQMVLHLNPIEATNGAVSKREQE